MPLLGEEEITEVTDTLRSGWLTTDPKTAQLEKDFCKFIGADYALAVNSATSGLHLALGAVDVGKGLPPPYFLHFLYASLRVRDGTISSEQRL